MMIIIWLMNSIHKYFILLSTCPSTSQSRFFFLSLLSLLSLLPLFSTTNLPRSIQSIPNLQRGFNPSRGTIDAPLLEILRVAAASHLSRPQVDCFLDFDFFDLSNFFLNNSLPRGPAILLANEVRCPAAHVLTIVSPSSRISVFRQHQHQH